MHKMFAVMTLMLLGAAPALAQDNPKCSDNPLFSRFAGERLSTCERMRFSSLELRRWKKPDDPKSGTEPHRVEGEYWYYVNDIERDALGRHPGKVEVRRNFEQAVRAAGGSVIGADNATVAYRIVRPDGEYWGQAGCGRGGDDCSATIHRIVRAAGMQQSVGVLGATVVAGGGTAGGQTSTPATGGAAGGAQGGAQGGAATPNDCNCQGAGAARPDWLPVLLAGLRPHFTAQVKEPDELTLYPARGTRGMLVHLAGPNAAAVTGVTMGGTPAQIVAVKGSRLTLIVPEVPSQPATVVAQTPAGRVTLRERFQVYQLPDSSSRTFETPCAHFEGGLGVRIASVTPQRALPGAPVTLTVPGLSVWQTRLDTERAVREATQRRAREQRQQPGQTDEERVLAALAGLQDSMGGGGSPLSLGVAFSFEPGVFQATGSGLFDRLAQAGSYHVPIVAVAGSGDTVTLRVPDRAISGPIAVVLFRSDFYQGDTIQQCSFVGPDFVVAPPPPRR